MGVVDNPFKLTVGKDGRICVSQEVVVYTREENDRIRSEFERLTSDNAKLRELVKDLYADMWDSGEWLEPYEQRIRELGIEVDA